MGGCGPKKYTVQYWTGEYVLEEGRRNFFGSSHETEVEEGRAFRYSPPTVSYTDKYGNTYYAHFQGWYLNTNFAIEFRPAYGIQTDTILYAKYDNNVIFRKK